MVVKKHIKKKKMTTNKVAPAPRDVKKQVEHNVVNLELVKTFNPNMICLFTSDGQRLFSKRA